MTSDRPGRIITGQSAHRAPRRGEIWLANLGPAVESEAAGKRPVIVLQNDELGQIGSVIIIPVTSSPGAEKHRTNAPLPPSPQGLPRRSAAQCHLIGAISREKFIARLSALGDDVHADMEIKVGYCLGLQMAEPD